MIYCKYTYNCPSPAGIEWVDTEHRVFIGVIGSLSWSAGNMLLAGFAFLVKDWRTLIMTVTAPLGFALLSWWCESKELHSPTFSEIRGVTTCQLFSALFKYFPPLITIYLNIIAVGFLNLPAGFWPTGKWKKLSFTSTNAPSSTKDQRLPPTPNCR